MDERTKDNLDICCDKIRAVIVTKLNTLGWNATKLADESGVNYLTVCNIIRGKTAPTLTTLVKILSVFGMTVEVVDNVE